MSCKTIILCPGQGAQLVGMGKDFYEASAAARETFDLANDILGFDIKTLCFTGPEEKLNQTDISQPAIFITSVACYRAAVEAGLIQPGAVSVFAGLSLGEYTALHLAGVFSFEVGLRLVQKRGQYMQEAAVKSPGGMVALLGADADAADKLCRENARGEVLVAANYNAPGQIVISGSQAACERAHAAAEAAGLKATALKVAGAFHSPLMQSGADKMQQELAAADFSAPATTVYSNVTAAPHTTAQSIKQLLFQQIVSPVKWEQTMRTLLDIAGENPRFIELAPNRHLAGLAKRINRRLPIESLSTAEALSVPVKSA